MTSPIVETQMRNGPLLLTHEMPMAQTVSLGIFLNVGSRDESAVQAGMAHALEHMLFKGTQRHDVDALAELLDRLGGTANAFTARERTCFHIRVLREDWREALQTLCDMVLQPTLPEDEWLREREVIYSEMAMAEDVPEDWMFDRHLEALYPGQKIGQMVLGSRDTLANFDRQSLAAFLDTYYRPPNMLIAASGAVSHNEMLEFLNARDWPDGRAVERSVDVHIAGGIQYLERDDEQAYFVISLPGITAASADRPVAWLANQMLGGGMSSRLFREVREKRGLAYGIASHLSGLSDTGAWSISGSTDPARLGECMAVVREVMQGFAFSINADEFARALRQLEVSLRMGMDSCEANMLHLGNRFDEPEILPQDAWVAAIRAISMDEVRDWAAAHLAQPALWTCSGPENALATLPDDLQA
ncbi:MAG: pitrilysin family protein [Mariprofundaceae bacterium]|nr:pitrilysin family protein [Mariprofundaceae bacterium]